jgi:multidrug efflux system membrane fusion protein
MVSHYGKADHENTTLGREREAAEHVPMTYRMSPVSDALRRRRIALAAAVAILGAPLTASAQQAAAGSLPPATAAPSGPVVPVTVAKVVRQDVPIWLRGLGTIQPFQAVQVRSRVDGVLQEVLVTEGQEVVKGDPLAVIDPRPFRALLDVALARRRQDLAELENARSDLARYTALAQKEIASRQKLDAVTMQVNRLTAGLAANEALIQSAELNLDFCVIRAPFDARVGLRTVDPGNVVRAAEATPLFSLVQIRPISATFTVPQDQLPRIQAAMGAGPLVVAAYAADDRTELDRGRLLTVDNAIDPGTGTIRLKATFANAANRLWPGQFVHLRLLVETAKDALTLPTAAVQNGPAGQFVYVVKPDSTVQRQPVDVARDDGAMAIIRKGVDEGQTVVRDGQSRLRAGSRIAATEPGRNSKPTAANAGS